MSGNQLRNQLRDLRRGDPTGGETFIPQRSLYRLLKRDVVSATLRQSGISVLHIDSLTDKILKGGQKVFTILVLLKGEESKIFDFVKRDQFSLLPLDSRLPFSVDALATIVPDIAQEFYETQWELLAPVFSKGVLHRELQDMIRLPYVRNKQIGRGGFGDVYEIELEPAHQTLAFTPPEDVSPSSSPLAFALLTRYRTYGLFGRNSRVTPVVKRTGKKSCTTSACSANLSISTWLNC